MPPQPPSCASDRIGRSERESCTQRPARSPTWWLNQALPLRSTTAGRRMPPPSGLGFRSPILPYRRHEHKLHLDTALPFQRTPMAGQGGRGGVPPQDRRRKRLRRRRQPDVRLATSHRNPLPASSRDWQGRSCHSPLLPDSDTPPTRPRHVPCNWFAIRALHP